MLAHFKVISISYSNYQSGIIMSLFIDWHLKQSTNFQYITLLLSIELMIVNKTYSIQFIDIIIYRHFVSVAI